MRRAVCLKSAPFPFYLAKLSAYRFSGGERRACPLGSLSFRALIPCIRVISGGDAVIGAHKRKSIIDQHVGSQENPTRWSASRQLRGALPPMLCGSAGAARHNWGRAREVPAQKVGAPPACTAALRQVR